MKFAFDQTEIAITHPDRDSLYQTLRDRFRAGQGFALATLNVDHLVKLGRDPGFRRAYAQQDIVVADGNPIVWLSKLAKKPVALLPGSDLLEPLCRLAVEAGLPVSLIGATPEALVAAAEVLKTRIPGLKIGLLEAPAMGFDPEGAEARAILSRLAAVGPGLCISALGAPKQELFGALGRQLAPQTGFAAFGAGVDFLAGRQQRAPAWVRAMAMEWLWRALSSPRRLIPRYAACFAILPGEAVKALRQRNT